MTGSLAMNAALLRPPSMQHRLTRMRQFQPHGVSITLYRTQITPCRCDTNLGGHSSYPIMSCLFDPGSYRPPRDAKANALCRPSLAARRITSAASAMDHLSRSVLSFRRDITMRADVVPRACGWAIYTSINDCTYRSGVPSKSNVSIG